VDGACELNCAPPLVDCGGFCTYTTDDPENCGACGTVCDETNAMAYCSGGACGLICATGYDDCDSDVTTGCEANLLRDSSNCGTCGTVCPTDWICYLGTCEFRTCPSPPYTDSFTRSVTPTTQCTSWDAWRATLDGRGCSMIELSGTFDTTGVVCTDPVVVEAIADALRTGTVGSWSCDGRTWRVGECGVGPGSWELSAAGSICSCPNPEYLLRPCIGNQNWGGINTATCTGPDQTMTVTFY
jgi:hypothetical protein